MCTYLLKQIKYKKQSTASLVSRTTRGLYLKTGNTSPTPFLILLAYGFCIIASCVEKHGKYSDSTLS